MRKLHIDPEFEAYLDDPERILEADLLQAIPGADNGCLDSIKVWKHDGQSTILDGHRRYRLAEKHPEIKFTTDPVDLPDRAAAYRWIYVYQFSRRNKVPTAAEIRSFRGRWYNEAKQDKTDNILPTGGNPKCQNDPSGHPPGETLQKQGSTAKQIAEQTGVSEATVKRNAAYVEALKKCSASVQKGINSGAFKASAADVQTLSELNEVNQDNIANDLRKGQANSVKEAMKLRGIKPPAGKKKKPTKPKPPKKLDKNALYKEWDKAIGPLIRTLNKIAGDVGEKNGPSHKVIQGQLDACTEEMGEWMQVKS